MLNERFVFLTLSNLVVGAVYALHVRAASSSVDAWPSFTVRFFLAQPFLAHERSPFLR